VAYTKQNQDTMHALIIYFRLAMLFFSPSLWSSNFLFNRLHPFGAKLKPKYFKFVEPCKIERKKTILKEEDKMGGNLKNSMKSSLWSSCFSSYKYSIPQFFKNTLLV